MKNKTLFAIIITLFSCAVLFGCSAKGGYGGDRWYGNGYFYSDGQSADGNAFDEIIENPFVDCTEENKTQAVSLTVNTAAFPIMKRYLDNGMEVPKNAVKIEEIINYFNYDYAAPQDGKTLALSGSVTDTPWNAETKLVTLGVRTREVDFGELSNNIVFLVDVSGSMYGEDRLDLVKESVLALSETLDENDRLSIVTYASGSKVVLGGARGNDRTEIENALKSLEAGGSTNGASGINLAYDVAFNHSGECDNSVIVIATDGDFNVGASTPDSLKKLISQNRRRGVYLSALGFGFNNLSDRNMQEIVASGQGAYAYIDGIDAARKALGGGSGSVLYFVAEEAKAQVEFNPSAVERFRLIGFENKMLTQEEFESSDTPAGALSSGSQVTAIFEIKLKENAQDGFGTFTAAYFERGEQTEKRDVLDLGADLYNPTDDTENAIKKADRDFISAAVEASLVLRKSEYKAAASYDGAIERLQSLCLSPDDIKSEFLDFVIRLRERV